MNACGWGGVGCANAVGLGSLRAVLMERMWVLLLAWVVGRVWMGVYIS